MAYTDTRPQENRTAIIAAVAIIHGLAAYAIVTGLAVKYASEVTTILAARNIRAELPPPPPLPDQPDVVPKPQDRPIDLPDRRIDMPSDGGYRVIDVAIPDIAPADISSVDLPPVPDIPKFMPQQPRPANDRGGWATTSDYPARDLREGYQGITGFRLIVGATGRVESCSVTRSSGFAGLDQATCRHVSRRARLRPATDASGQPATGEYASTVRWVIPE